jgi:DNA polymerase III delta subunit, C-terminal domain
MIKIIHGDDTASSRNYYISERDKAESPVIFEGEKLRITPLMQSLQGGSLFNEEQEIFVENFFSTKKSNPEFKAITDYLKTFSQKANITFWENTEVSKTDISSFENPAVKLFKIPQKMFLFVDSIKPGSLNNIKLFHELLEQAPVELVFFMIIRQFRILLATSDYEDKNPIDEVKRLAPWQMSKFKSQAKLFGGEKLLKAYNQIYKIDSASKSGKLPATLTQAIDFFLLGL